MDNFVNYECTTEFNVPTSFIDEIEYQKREQESTDPLKYIMDITPGKYCFVSNTYNQGLQIAQKSPPVELLDIEDNLRRTPIISEANHYITDNVYNKLPPALPSVMENRLLVSECATFIDYESTLVKRMDLPQWSYRNDLTQRKQAEYMRPGRDTRTEVKDYFKQADKTKLCTTSKQNTDSYYCVDGTNVMDITSSNNTNYSSYLGTGPAISYNTPTLNSDSTPTYLDLLNKEIKKRTKCSNC